jgi:hypothetical protein
MPIDSPDCLVRTQVTASIKKFNCGLVATVRGFWKNTAHRNFDQNQHEVELTWADLMVEARLSLVVRSE